LAKDLHTIKDGPSRRKKKMFQAAGQKGSQLAQICKIIDENKSKFRHPVFGPVGAEISCQTSTIAMCAQSAIGFKFATSFVVQCKADSDFLYAEVR